MEISVNWCDNPAAGNRHSCWESRAKLNSYGSGLDPAAATVVRRLDQLGYANIFTATRDQLDRRDREDRRYQAVPGLSHAVRERFHFGDAHEPVRPEGQLRPVEFTRAAGDDPQVPRRQDRRPPRGTISHIGGLFC